MITTSPKWRICLLVALLSAGSAAPGVIAGEKIVFSNSGGETGLPEAGKKDPRLTLPWSSGNSVPGQRIVFSNRVDPMDAPESVRKESLLAPTLDLIKSPTSIAAPISPMLPAGISDEAPAPLTKRQQQMLDQRAGWIYDTKENQKNGAAAEYIQDSVDKTGNKPKSGMERFLEARAQSHRDSATNGFDGDYGYSRRMNADGTFMRGSIDGSSSSKSPGEFRAFDGGRLDADLLGRGPRDDSLFGAEGEKPYQRIGSEFQDRARERHAADFEGFRKMFDPTPGALSSSSLTGQTAIDAARQAGAPYNLQGLGDFSHKMDGGSAGFSARNIGGLGASGNLFDTGARPFGSQGPQSPQTISPDPLRPRPAPSSFDLPRRDF